MPKTQYDNIIDNPVSQIFWGRVKLAGAISLIYFQKGSKYRKLLHKLKYNGEMEVGIEMGKMLGGYLKNLNILNFDIIVPVPLHKSRYLSRGYNQSEMIASGISEIIDVPVDVKSIKRMVYNITQTGKGRYDRWENVEGIFKVVDAQSLNGKNILLVDDVITTGATLEACAAAIQKNIDCNITVCTMAYSN